MIWTPPQTRIRLEEQSTQGSANLAKALFDHNPSFITLAQGNHHPVHGRMAKELREAFTHVSRPYPVYQNDPAGIAHAIEVAAGWEKRFTGVPANGNNTLLLKQQGRYALGCGIFALVPYHGNTHFKFITPNLRWREFDIHLNIAGIETVDYDITAKDALGSIKRAVKAAGGPEHVGALYLCSPNNPTGRRFTAEEYREIREYVDSINLIRVEKKLSKLLIICDDPYFEACSIRHCDLKRAEKGNDPYLDTGYGGLFNNSLNFSPILVLHSMSKFAEQAGTHGITFAVSTDEKFTKHYKKILKSLGALGYDEDFMRVMSETFRGGRYDELMLERCSDVGKLFTDCWNSMNKRFPDKLLVGSEKTFLPNMVGCRRVPLEDFMHCKAEYPDGKIVTIDSIDALIETLGNFHGVGFVPEKDDKKIFAEGYDSENEALIRIALNDPKDFDNGMLRSNIGLKQIEECTRKGTVLKHTPSLLLV